MTARRPGAESDRGSAAVLEDAVVEQVWQKCPECGFQFLIAQDELAGEQVVCPECGTFFDFDPEGELE